MVWEVIDVGVLRIILSVVFILISIALTVLVLAQEGKTQNLGAIQGFAETTYWGKNKGRSKEGILKKVTVVRVVFFIVLSVVLNLTMF